MRTKKLASLAAVAALAIMMVSSVAKADPAAVTIHAGGVLLDGTNAAAGSANVTVTTVDGDDVDTLPDPVPGILIEYWVGETLVPCAAESATTDPSGVARCGLLGELPGIIENLGYTAKFAGNEVFAAGEDHGGLIFEQGVDIP